MCEDVDWIEVAHYRIKWQALLSTIMILRVS